MSREIFRLLASAESWSFIMVMTEKLSELTLINPSISSIIRIVYVNEDLKKNLISWSSWSPRTVGTLGRQFDSHIRASDW